MIPAEQWQKEAGTWMIHCQGADEEHPVLTVDLIKRIQRDAWEQGVRDGSEFEHYIDALLKRGPQ